MVKLTYNASGTQKREDKTYGESKTHNKDLQTLRNRDTV